MNFIAKILLNSLYGRFGMDDNFLQVNIIHKDYYPDYENKFFDYILNSVDLGDYKIVSHKLSENQIETDESTHNVSIGIAAAITAYARIHMSQFKNNLGINLYYTDTDSIYTDSDIDESFISETALGKLKTENICNKAIFLAPKLYCLETQDGKMVYKVKGLKSEVDLSMDDFEQLLYKNVFIEKSQIK
jgi:DNA polymerase elongation subunit (family B)